MAADGGDQSGRIIRLVLIHNNDPGRLLTSRATAATVKNAMAPLGKVEIVEISRQPNFRHLSFRSLAIRHLDQWWLERKWAAYLGVSRRWVLSSGLLAVRLAQLCLPGIRRARERRANMELCLSAKHELAWRQAYEDHVDTLVVLEDDAALHAESASRLRDILDEIRGEDLAGTYLDLAGGLSLSELRLRHLVHNRAHGLLELTKPATNTSCAYALGTVVLADLAATTTLLPNVTRFPSDWVINSHFIGSRARVTCLHAVPPALLHGSQTGAVPSSFV